MPLPVAEIALEVIGEEEFCICETGMDKDTVVELFGLTEVVTGDEEEVSNEAAAPAATSGPAYWISRLERFSHA